MNPIEGVRRDNVDDQELLRHLRPRDYQAPTPASRYDLVVIGGGPGGLVAAHGAAGLGARVALVERGLLGGDCLNVGCVPSKALLAAAAGGVSGATDGASALRHARRARAGIAPHDGVARLREAGIDVFLGEASFASSTAVRVGSAVLHFARAVLATGARAARPPIPGLDHPEVVTAEGVWRLDEVPDRLAILGAGPIGVEMAQAMARLGSAVTVFDMAPRVLPREDPEAAAVVEAALRGDGVTLRLGYGVEEVRQDGAGWRVRGRRDDDAIDVQVDRVLVALGRTPNVDALALDRAGIAADRGGVVVDDKLRTANPRVYAIGDVIGGGFTHVADAQARLVVQNALVAPTARWSDARTPACTYTHPEVAHLGPSFSALEGRGDLEAITIPWSDLDRGQAEGSPPGFVRAWVDRQGRLVGATVVGEGAGELIAPGAILMGLGLPVEKLSQVVLPYPTRSEAWKRVGDALRKRRLTPAVAGLLRGWIRLRARWA